MAILEMDKLEGTDPPEIETAHCRMVGQVLRSRLIKQWPRWGETLKVWRGVMAENGHGGRGADVFGTLLAMSNIMLWPKLFDEDMMKALGKKLSAANLSETAEDVPDHERCLEHLLTSMVNIYRHGAQKNVGSWLSDTIPKHKDILNQEATEQKEANDTLCAFGLKMHIDRKDGSRWFAVANSHKGITGFYEGTHWSSRSGASGVWVQSLRRIEGAKAGLVRFGPVIARATLIPLSVALPTDDDHEGSMAIDTTSVGSSGPPGPVGPSASLDTGETEIRDLLNSGPQGDDYAS